MRGKLEGCYRDYAKDCWVLQIATPDKPTEYDELKDKDVSVTIKAYKKGRSLDANAMYWALLTELAKRLEISNAEAHNSMLAMYGQIEVLDDKAVYMVIPDTEEAEHQIKQSESYHLKPTSEVRQGKDGKMYRTYMMLRGSKSYNTAEFSRLLNGLIEECNLIGIPTASQAEIELLLERYKGGDEKHHAERKEMLHMW